MASVPAVSRQEIEYAVHHVFLPPKVPQSAPDDAAAFWNEAALLRILGGAIAEFRTLVETELVAAVNHAHLAVSRLNELQNMTPQKLEAPFEEVVRNGGYVPIHIRAQNAGILVSRSDNGKSVVFEFFELAPTNQAAMSTQGRLRRRFPGSAVAVPLTIFDDEELHRALANTIATMDRQEVSEMKPRVRKAGKEQIEERDTTDPSMVTDFLATILCAVAEGQEERAEERVTVAQLLPAVAKNTREQVCWNDALLPWRRSASWLLSRVALQIILSRAHGRSLYKGLVVFFMARILQEALCQPFSLELIHCMVAKISGRVQKLTRGPHCQPWLQVVEETVSEAVSFMETSWEAIIRKADPVQEMRLISAEQIERDTCIKLPELQEFLESVSARETVVHSQLSSPSWLVPELSPLNLPSAAFDQDGDGAVADLFAVEEWVDVSLDDWLSSNISNNNTASRLLQLSQVYDRAAQRQYFQDPDAISLMVLTILELWVACDKSVCKLYPLLLEYRHEIPKDLLQSLVLRDRSQLRRLHRVETYLETRENRASQSWTPSIFSSFATIDSFGVRYFASSPQHQDLKSRIETRAQHEREAKTAEFTKKQAEYRHHMGRSRELSCEYYEGYNKKTGLMFTEHSNNCDKCRHKKAAANLSIAVHEWPLPASRTAAENVVFELNVPGALCAWRDATAFVVLDVLRSKRASCNAGRPVGYLAKYLSSHFEMPQHGCGRFVLASTAKSHQNTHRKMQSLGTASVDNVLVVNGLHYGYYDQVMSTWVTSCDETDVLPKQCTYPLSNSCAGLAQFMFRPHRHPSGKTPNHIVSQQWECAEHLSLDEFKAMAALPCGYGEAKDSPSPRSEFSHPDVVILLTCLSYYYEGLSNADLFAAFAHLVKSDQADINYERWVKDASDLATSFQSLSGVNIKDADQVTEQIFPSFRFAKAVIDYYLSHLVFPKEMRDFSQKLSVSGWDLGEQKSNPTTGFSGTNDSSHVLPLDVRQLRIGEQMHTNALVLETLLRAGNKVQLLLPAGDGRTEPHAEFSFIDSLFHFVADIKNEVHVLLDVGAQVLELTNVQVAKKWLELLPANQAQEAVVYFDDNDELFVINRKGIAESLLTSPYSNQLGRCLVFLDQAHTRGTDLKLPEHYRAAVTLGPDLTKDGLVQACMRMRKLGRGQSVVFCVSPEMEFRISKSTAQVPGDNISVETVLMWAVYETYVDLHSVMPLWATQGFRFERQKQVWAGAKTPVGIQMSPDQAQELLEEEAQTVEVRYRPTSSSARKTMCSQLDVPSPDTDDGEALAAIRTRCADFGVSISQSAALQEEQERELAPEIEQEREIERPEPAPAAVHQVHPDVVRFVATGIVVDDSPAFYAAFTTLTSTSMAATSDLAQFPRRLLVTADYARTVQLTSTQRQTPGSGDAYQRPIQWILTGAAESRDGDEQSLQAIIISPHEAQELLPQIKESSSCARLHLYAPRTSLAFASLDELRLYTVPALDDDGDWRLPDDLRLQLNLFAGQLYFSSYADCTATCNMLSLAWRPPSRGSGIVVEADGFIAAVLGEQRGSPNDDSQATFVRSPISSLKVLFMVLRGNCQEIDNTHWGRIMAGELLTEEDFVQQNGMSDSTARHI